MPYLDIQQIHSAGAHTVGGRVTVWAQSGLTESYQGIRDVEGHFQKIVEPPCPCPRCEHEVVHARGGKEQHRAAGCWRRLSDRQTMVVMVSLHWLVDTLDNGSQLYTGITSSSCYVCKVLMYVG